MFPSREYVIRRQQLAKKLSSGSVAIIPAAPEVTRNGDATYRFRQDSDFFYLTGFNEPDAILVIMAGQSGESILFNRPRDPLHEQWTGRRLGQEDAKDVLSVQEAWSVDDFSQQLPELIANKTAIYYTPSRYPHIEKIIWRAIKTVKGQVRKGVSAPSMVCDLEPFLSEMRLIKSTAEVKLMQRAADISVAGHLKAIQVCRHSAWEYELEAALLYEFIRQGSRGLAYDPIVGCGENACVLHYTANNQPLHAGQMVLIDAAAEFDNYAADITRTFPVKGTFSGEQRAIYELVYTAQRAGIACIKPGVSWDLIQLTMVRLITLGLCDLGILKGQVDDLIANEAYKPFYMHNSGHWLGLDVHDCGQYKVNQVWRTLESGMVMTVEPGIYITPEIPGVDPRWWNIGVRIEDDILVKGDGHRNLTEALPTAIHDIEALMRE